ncbi:hypothetical protein ACP70R_007305 [Stipagrostis hirtigluma subsp. patula]
MKIRRHLHLIAAILLAAVLLAAVSVAGAFTTSVGATILPHCRRSGADGPLAGGTPPAAAARPHPVQVGPGPAAAGRSSSGADLYRAAANIGLDPAAFAVCHGLLGLTDTKC